MKIQKSFKIALNIIFHSKLRSWLTIIGIVIGIAAVVSIVSIGQGAERNLEQNLNSLNADIITISPGFSRAMGAETGFRSDFGGSRTGTTAKNLTVSDVMTLKGILNIAYVTGVISGSVDSVSFLGKTARGSIEGVDPSMWKNIVSSELDSGRYLSQGDLNVVVVGGRVASSTFSGMEINRQVIIGGQNFRIVGILKSSGSGGGGGSSDDNRIIMPIENAITVLTSKDKKTFDSIIVKVKDISITNETITEIIDRLMLSHGILQSGRQDFSVESPTSMQARISSTLSSTSVFLTAIAVISLIVGAIGIMNTMFTSVLEKTRDIGILKAIGAKDRDILTIFLLNSGIIGLIGGVLGIIIGIFASGYIGQLSGTTTLTGGGGAFGRMLASTYISPQLIIGVFVLSIAVGLISGAIPAYRASKLNPVDALRYE